MREVGEFLHRAKSGRLIVRLSEEAEPGSVLLDEKGRGAARITELIGPVARPYASAVPLSDRLGGERQKFFLPR
jgi:RNA-binding protein